MNYKQWTLSTISTAIALVLATLVLHAVTTPAISPTTQENALKGQISPIAGIINKLIECESGGNPNAVHYNDGAAGLHSRGILQFQRPTFARYWRNLINNDIDDVDVDNLWTDASNQILLAEAMITDNPKNLNHWKVCSTKHDLYSKL